MEVIAALGIAVVAITALVSLSIATLRTSLDSKLLLEGTKIANREIELVRACRDGKSWPNFITDLNTSNCDQPDGCHMADVSTIAAGSHAEGTGIETVTRKFVVSVPEGALDSDPPPDIIRISVSVNWKIGDQQKGSYVYTDLSNWRKQ